MSERVSKSRLAEICNVSRGTVSNWIRSGRIFGRALVGTGVDQKINLKTALRQLDITLDPGQSSGEGAARAAAVDKALGGTRRTQPTGRLAAAAEIKDAKLRHLRARADLAEIRLGIDNGSMAPWKQAEEVWGDYFTNQRQAVLRMITSLSVILPHLDRAQHLAIDRVIRAKMIEFVNA